MNPGHASTILFGAFDRHNVGDLLFPHIAAALLHDKALRFAGLAERDLRDAGGHRVDALSRLAAQPRNGPLNLVHAGGELLTCSAWEAAVMLLPPERAQQAIACYQSRPQQRDAWAQALLGTSSLAPYTVSRAAFPEAAIVYNAVGGVELDLLDAAMRDDVLANLAAADFVGVRDGHTAAALAAAGVSSVLLPDPAVLTAELFGVAIARRTMAGDAAQARRCFPQGYLAVQFSADFGDDATLAAIASQLDAIAQASGIGIAFFRAGVAPWHDDLDCYRRAAARMRTPAFIAASLHLLDICALIACSRACCASSLHARIIATAFALPRVTLRSPSQGDRPSKHTAYAATWETTGMPAAAGPGDIAAFVGSVLAANRDALRQEAETLALRYRMEFGNIAAMLA